MVDDAQLKRWIVLEDRETVEKLNDQTLAASILQKQIVQKDHISPIRFANTPATAIHSSHQPTEWRTPIRRSVHCKLESGLIGNGCGAI
jgi:hypothetical protein